MSDINDGGPAFPQLCTAWNDDAHKYELSMSLDGMSLRDYFAAKAMQPLTRTVQKNGKTGPDAGDDDFVWVARRAYMLADAMLKAREQQ
jgi:hypothetical protein